MQDESFLEIAESAARLFVDRPIRIDPIGHSAAATFRVTSGSDALGHLLRVHVPKVESDDSCWHEPAAIRSELLWLRALAGAGLPVQAPVPSRSGDWIVELDGSRSRTACSCLRWIDGESLEAPIDEDVADRLGQVCATLHAQAASWAAPLDFSRPSYDATRVERSLERFSSLDRAGVIDGACSASIARAVERATDPLRQVLRTEGQSGLIHADLHPGNCLAVGRAIHVIDFGRCGFGAWSYDVAEALQYLGPEERRAFLRGYRRARPDTLLDAEILEPLLLIAIVDAFATHANDPDERAYLTSAIPTFVSSYAEPFLHGRPFLFGPESS